VAVLRKIQAHNGSADRYSRLYRTAKGSEILWRLRFGISADGAVSPDIQRGYVDANRNLLETLLDNIRGEGGRKHSSGASSKRCSRGRPGKSTRNLTLRKQYQKVCA